jgi:hypothetical protein
MVDVLNTLEPEVKEQIDYKEWSIKNAEGIGMFMERKGRVLPTLCIDKTLCYESVIPTIDELYEKLIELSHDDAQKAILQTAYDKFQAEYK